MSPLALREQPDTELGKPLGIRSWLWKQRYLDGCEKVNCLFVTYDAQDAKVRGFCLKL